MQNAALKKTIWTAAALLAGATILALFATVSNDEAAAHLNRISAHRLAGVAPGKIYQIVDGEPRGAPVCRVRDLSGVLVQEEKGDIEFRNSLGQMIPFVARLAGLLGSEKSNLDADMVSDEFHTIRWASVVDLYIPTQDIEGRILINPKCQETIESLLRGGATVCIIQSVMHHASSKTHVYAFDWRSRCIDHCPYGECTNVNHDTSHLELRVGIWSQMKFALALISHQIFLVEDEAGEEMAALGVD